MVKIMLITTTESPIIRPMTLTVSAAIRKYKTTAGQRQTNVIFDHGRPFDIAGRISEKTCATQFHAIEIENADKAAQKNA